MLNFAVNLTWHSDKENMKYDFCVNGSACGDVLVRLDGRARRFVFRCVDGKLFCTSPVRFNETAFLMAVERLRPKLERMMERSAERNVGEGFAPHTRIDTEYIHFRMEESDVKVPKAEWKIGEMVCRYPEEQDLNDGRFRKWLESVLEKWLCCNAEAVLPERLRKMADARGLKYNELKITRAKSRWGSCNTRKNICLSGYLMVLPTQLQDYVMQHELTHLLEMNHGPRFRAILDEAVGGMSAKYCEDLKHFRPSVF